MNHIVASGAVASALLRFAVTYILLSGALMLVARIAGGALPGTTIVTLAVATVMARRRFFALRGRQPTDNEKIPFLFGAFAIAMVLSSLIVIAVAVGHGYPEPGIGETIAQMSRARPADVLIVRYLLGALAYFLIIWISFGLLLEGFSTPARAPDKDDGGA